MLRFKNTIRSIQFAVLTAVILTVLLSACSASRKSETVPDRVMQRIYKEVSTPFKYGIVFRHPDSTKMMDSPSIFRWNNSWFMTYIVYDGRGYETWLAESSDLLHWSTKGRILSFTEKGWDANQKAGYMSLIDTRWDGSYAPASFQGRYWMSYLGGSVAGYEAGQLRVGIAYSTDPSQAKEWTRIPQPVLSASDSNARWFESSTIFKSTVIEDTRNETGKRFAMFYNASGDTARYESIGMAVSDDLLHWKRLGKDPVISRYRQGTICGDAQIVRMGKLYVMFYFGAFWSPGGHAFEQFACSYDLMHWTEWKGTPLVEPSEPYDEQYAHKPFVIKWNGIVYHFYNAVGKTGRVIALATSKPVK